MANEIRTQFAYEELIVFDPMGEFLDKYNLTKDSRVIVFDNNHKIHSVLEPDPFDTKTSRLDWYLSIPNSILPSGN